MILIEPDATKSFKASALRKRELSRFLNAAQKAAKLRGRVDVLLTDDAGIKRLNRDFRKKNKATDVLSFPAFAPPGLKSPMAGDLAISLDTASRQAESFGHTLEVELQILMLHGLLHLTGLDHETDKGEMAAYEAALRVELGLPTGLIQRSGTR
ncbi:rRNA maturation RNase YbeY [Acidipila rosea]|uniref:Endoribonuclease YbeY n=1 Tax=Acidipila rosea TaxID=768535 RepID=A0A4R1LCM0_9BACT|nr:rRNA maturation RNase YbeY [Acidipila rosea]MBW4027074.1 rRNA maturation RNase YbeY [Acidobacteriota bacterium]MBW4045142.1 rRNA maturation RNase YbeY [Acidobacteriota bacterium]TCK75377.1 putative rRNA maturation factor [Acidipila rosea]